MRSSGDTMPDATSLAQELGVPRRIFNAALERAVENGLVRYPSATQEPIRSWLRPYKIAELFPELFFPADAYATIAAQSRELGARSLPDGNIIILSDLYAYINLNQNAMAAAARKGNGDRTDRRSIERWAESGLVAPEPLRNASLRDLVMTYDALRKDLYTTGELGRKLSPARYHQALAAALIDGEIEDCLAAAATEEAPIEVLQRRFCAAFNPESYARFRVDRGGYLRGLSTSVTDPRESSQSRVRRGREEWASQSRDPQTGLHPHNVARLVESGRLERAADGSLTPESVARHRAFMEDHHYIRERMEHLAMQAGITENTLNNKVFVSHQIADYLVNIGSDRAGGRLYAYKRSDEPAIIERLHLRPKGRRRKNDGKISPRTRQLMAAVDIGDISKIKLTDAASRCGMDEALLREALPGIGLREESVLIGNISVPVLDADAYQTVRRYVWEHRQLPVSR